MNKNNKKELSFGSSDSIPDGYTRVTEILKPFSKFENIKPEVLQNAADRGTRVHSFCEMYANNLFIDDIDDDCKGYIQSFKPWWDEMVVKLIYSEQRINNDQFKISGKFDFVVLLKGDPENHWTILDIKTPSTISKTWALQTAAYDVLLAHEGVECYRRACLMLDKKGSVAKFVEFTDHLNDADLFYKALELYRFFNP